MKTRVTTISNLVLSLTFTMGLASCNQSDFYQKENLVDTFQAPTTNGSAAGGQEGGVTGNVGGTQGGVNTGVNGGTTGSTTGSSSTTGGGVDGSTTSGLTTGGTTGGVTGSTTVGSTTGGVTGSTTAGSTTGGVTGSTTAGSTTGGVTGSTTAGSTTGGTTTGSTTGGTTGVVYQAVEESFKQSAAETKKVDILWVIDDSGSMADEQSALGANFSAFIDDFITKDVDFKMAITTTDTSSANRKGKMVFGSDVKLTSAMAHADEAQFKADFKNLVKVGTIGSGYEKGLEATEGFMARYTNFLRPDAYLAVVIVSDEQDQSPKSVSAYTDTFKNYKSEGGLVKVYSIVDVKGTPGITGADVRYSQVSKNTAGTVGDIHENFYHTLSDIGSSLINLLDSFALSNNPVAGSLKVYVNGIETTSYTYDAASRSIKFDHGNLPPVGAAVKVTYLK